jgi:hypothetical protein
MSRIPNDIMQAAREAVASVYIENEFSEVSGRVVNVRSGEYDQTIEVQACARAILAERQACEKVARDRADQHFEEGFRGFSSSRQIKAEEALKIADGIAKRSS